MNIKSLIDKKIFSIILFSISMLGVYAGFEAAERFEFEVKGLMGVALLYFVYLLCFPKNNFLDKPFSELEKSYNIYKYLLICFVLAILVSWGIYFAFDLIYYYCQRFLFN
jgi:predicted ferric reductase